MNCIERLQQLHDEPLDRIITKIHKGTIKCGKYAGKIKVDPDKLLKRKEFLNNGK